MERIRPGPQLPKATQVIRQLVDWSRYIPRGTRISPPADSPEAFRPTTVARRRRNQRDSKRSSVVQGHAAEGNGRDDAKQEDEEQVVESEAQGHGGHAENGDAHGDYPAASEAVQQLAHKGLGNSVYHEAQGGSEGNGTHGSTRIPRSWGGQKIPKLLRAPVGNESYENAGGNDVPAIEYRFALFQAASYRHHYRRI